MNTIPEYPNYKATKEGQIWSNRQAIFLKPRIINGYPIVSLAGKTCLIRRLVLQTFVGPCPDGAHARNLNGDKLDNRLENLVWKQRRGKVVERLTQDQEDEIMRLQRDYPEKWTLKLFCKCFGATKKQIRDILGNIE